MLFVVMLTAPGGDAFAADGEPVNFLLFGGTAHLRRRVGIGDPNRPQVSWRRAFGNTRQYPAIPSNTQPGSTLSFASGGPLFRTAIVAFVALTTTSAEQVGTGRHDVGSRSIQRMHSTKSGSSIALLTCYIDTARGYSPVEANFAPAMHANPAPSVAINSQGLAISDSPANR
ncbi:hypothetical protein [Burkholderia cepacia]|uniref:Uncharacterized protein n=1 Tax=Burkholderia cepacia TaxID=292 RepID=A0A8I1AW60_BURCE|nr:hypothetical protein [Burkholderia cepacia]MBH9700397.1 hypothetical protein [Burkholderia cepacia]MBH9714108.1 hypothetical protein [Burkholderia cepacia]MBH9734452.1 hypothetical protein [Burkholderia cepacia]MBX3762806.1 hypothetical protein [Burkholderia cepacia]